MFGKIRGGISYINDRLLYLCFCIAWDREKIESRQVTWIVSLQNEHDGTGQVDIAKQRPSVVLFLSLHHQENRITCGTTTLTQTTLPQISSGDIMLVVATHAPQSFVAPRVFHNLIMGPQIQLLKHLFTVPWYLTYDHFFVLWYYASSHYSCRQSKSSNLQTDFLGLQKASELVDNGINELLLMSFINSNEQNFQKWQYKGFIPQKFGACMKK